MFSHIDKKQNPKMVDVSAKSVSWRTATAECRVRFPDAVYQALQKENWRTAKGSLIQTAIIAGVMAAKNTHHLIPFCHPLGLEKCDIDIEDADNSSLRIRCKTGVHHKTGVEMEALTGASVAALTIYDMSKALSHEIEITELRLLDKSGGKSSYQRDAD